MRPLVKHNMSYVKYLQISLDTEMLKQGGEQ